MVVDAQVPGVPWSVCYPSHDVHAATEFCRDEEIPDCTTEESLSEVDPTSLECLMKCDTWLFSETPSWDCEAWGMVCVEDLTCIIPDHLEN